MVIITTGFRVYLEKISPNCIAVDFLYFNRRAKSSQQNSFDHFLFAAVPLGVVGRAENHYCMATQKLKNSVRCINCYKMAISFYF